MRWNLDPPIRSPRWDVKVELKGNASSRRLFHPFIPNLTNFHRPYFSILQKVYKRLPLSLITLVITFVNINIININTNINMKYSIAAVVLAAMSVSASYNDTVPVYPTGVVYTTEVVDVYTTYCPYATTLTYGTKTYTVSEATTLTITDVCSLPLRMYTINETNQNSVHALSPTQSRYLPFHTPAALRPLTHQRLSQPLWEPTSPQALHLSTALAPPRPRLFLLREPQAPTRLPVLPSPPSPELLLWSCRSVTKWRDSATLPVLGRIYAQLWFVCGHLWVAGWIENRISNSLYIIVGIQFRYCSLSIGNREVWSLHSTYPLLLPSTLRYKKNALTSWTMSPS